MNNVIRIWRSRNQILEGITNNVFRKDHVEEIAKERMEICSKCDSIDKTGKTCVVIGTAPCCGACGCSLKLKTRSLSSECDRGFWKAELTEEEEDKLNEHLGID